ncbi:EAL domain-containing protein [Teredinibacter franksiae]|uniref:EAL domain-containing protein n=1 Tax=Teredinibacter franksiae TaxID=2761453 RepID=UPI00162936C4|nr:EAL domain-containing protein [Teredinibacter franksiae]
MRLLMGLFIAVMYASSWAGIHRVHPMYLEENERSDIVSAVATDQYGYLWLASDSGLKRYDGYGFKVFSGDGSEPGVIGTSFINTLMIDSQQRLWAAGTNLNVFDPKTETFSTFIVAGNTAIRAIYEDANGIFWLGGEGFGLTSFNPDTGEVLQRLFNNTNKGFIRKIIAKKGSEEIWVASGAGLYLFNLRNQAYRTYELPLNFAFGEITIRDLKEDDDGFLWVASNDGLFVLNPDTGTYTRYSTESDSPHVLATNALWSLQKDSLGRIWIGTDKKGAYRYDKRRGTMEYLPSSTHNNFHLPPGPIDDIHIEDSGTVWFSVGSYGMYRVSEYVEKFRSYQHNREDARSLAFDNVLGMLEDRDGNIWIATDGGGLDKFDTRTQQFTHLRHDPADPSSISTDSVLALAEDAKGYIWIGTWGGGLNRLNPKTGKIKRILRNPTADKNKTLANNNVFRIVVMEDQRLLMSIWRRGLQIYNPVDGTFEAFFPLDAENLDWIRNFSVNDIVAIDSETFWIAGFQGLELFSLKDKIFKAAAEDITEAINDIHVDRNGIVWLASNAGFYRYSPATLGIEKFTTENGLADDYVVSIEEDDLGYLWLGTRDGLSRFNPRTQEFLSFDVSDGLASTDFNRYSQLKTRDGRMYFGGTTGFSSFDPAHLPRNEHAPSVHLTGLRLAQKIIDSGTNDWLPNSIDHTEELRLPYSQRDIAFDFTALNYISPLKNRYRYRLLGLENEWRDVSSSERRVRYTNLDAGTYTFQVLGSNNEDVWSGAAKELRLKILPAWWETWWARLMWICCFLLILYGFSYLRLRSNKRREKELELMVGEQTAMIKRANRAVVQLNSELEQRVAHRTQELETEIEERKESEERANYIAYHDSLTGLKNRAWLLNHLDHRLMQCRESDTEFSLFFIGGDRFRKINDTHGHILGDKLLLAASDRLKRLLPEGEHAVRLGSDEFTVVIDEVTGTERTFDLAEQIIVAFSEPFIIEKIRMNFSVSVGMVIGKPHYSDSTQLLRNANIAMQRAKDRGRGVYQMFDEEILQHTLDAVELENDLKQALRRGQFSVVYQPIVVVATGELSGFEVLLRWTHPTQGMIPPDKFIPMAEQLGLIFDIGLWVLETACMQLHQWKHDLDLMPLPTIAVNLSAVQLGQADLLQRIDAVFERTGVNPNNIKLEITESALMKFTDTVDQLLDSLRQRNIELAIDDFGTGYSSLSYLDKLPVQVLKIDRAFVNALYDTNTDNTGAHEIVRATISLAHNLKMRVVAEGIETQQQMDALESYRCDYAQGYMIAKPLAPALATEYLRSSSIISLPHL